MKKYFFVLGAFLFLGCAHFKDLSKDPPFVNYIGKPVPLLDDQVLVQVPKDMQSGVLPIWLVSVEEYQGEKAKRGQYH